MIADTYSNENCGARALSEQGMGCALRDLSGSIGEQVKRELR